MARLNLESNSPQAALGTEAAILRGATGCGHKGNDDGVAIGHRGPGTLVCDRDAADLFKGGKAQRFVGVVLTQFGSRAFGAVPGAARDAQPLAEYRPKLQVDEDARAGQVAEVRRRKSGGGSRGKVAIKSRHPTVGADPRRPARRAEVRCARF